MAKYWLVLLGVMSLTVIIYSIYDALNSTYIEVPCEPNPNCPTCDGTGIIDFSDSQDPKLASMSEEERICHCATKFVRQ